MKLGFIQKGAEFERIIQIYGVDIDEWAILLTEFRFYMEFLNFKVERQAILEDQKISILTSLVQNPLFHSQLIKQISFWKMKIYKKNSQNSI